MSGCGRSKRARDSVASPLCPWRYVGEFQFQAPPDQKLTGSVTGNEPNVSFTNEPKVSFEKDGNEPKVSFEKDGARNGKTDVGGQSERGLVSFDFNNVGSLRPKYHKVRRHANMNANSYRRTQTSQSPVELLLPLRAENCRHFLRHRFLIPFHGILSDCCAVSGVQWIFDLTSIITRYLFTDFDFCLAVLAEQQSPKRAFYHALRALHQCRALPVYLSPDQHLSDGDSDEDAQKSDSEPNDHLDAPARNANALDLKARWIAEPCDTSPDVDAQGSAVEAANMRTISEILNSVHRLRLPAIDLKNPGTSQPSVDVKDAATATTSHTPNAPTSALDQKTVEEVRVSIAALLSNHESFENPRHFQENKFSEYDYGLWDEGRMFRALARRSILILFEDPLTRLATLAALLDAGVDVMSYWTAAGLAITEQLPWCFLSACLRQNDIESLKRLEQSHLWQNSTYDMTDFLDSDDFVDAHRHWLTPERRHIWRFLDAEFCMDILEHPAFRSAFPPLPNETSSESESENASENDDDHPPAHVLN